MNTQGYAYEEYIAEREYNYDDEGLFGVSPEQIMDGMRKNVSFMRTKTYKYGRVLESEIFPYWSSPRSARRARATKPTREAIEKVNRMNLVKKISRYANANFDETDYWATFGWAARPASMEEAYRDTINFLARLKRIYQKAGAEFRYIYVIEWGEEIRPHVHLILSGGVTREAIESKWKGGARKQTRALQPDDMGVTGLAHYFVKLKNCERKWNHSNNLKLPVPTIADNKITHRGIAKIVSSEEDAREFFEKIYPGYELKELKIKYSDVVAGVYVYATMAKALCADCINRTGGKCGVFVREKPLKRRTCHRYEKRRKR